MRLKKRKSWHCYFLCARGAADKRRGGGRRKDEKGGHIPFGRGKKVAKLLKGRVAYKVYIILLKSFDSEGGEERKEEGGGWLQAAPLFLSKIGGGRGGKRRKRFLRDGRTPSKLGIRWERKKGGKEKRTGSCSLFQMGEKGGT